MNDVEKAIEGFKIDNVLLFGSNSDEVIERNKLAIQVLQAQAEKDNPQPLTLVQLKQMDGRPVFIVGESGQSEHGAWAMVKSLYEMAECAYGSLFTFKNYEKTWLAYSHKPKENENG